jgi:hypothetical protein
MIPLGSTLAGGPAISYLQSANDTANRSTYAFLNQNIGAAAADRYIVISIGTVGNYHPSVTVAGVSAPLVIREVTYIGFGGDLRVGIYIAAVPSGATGTITANYARSIDSCSYAAWRVTGLLSPTAFDTASDISTGGSVDVNVPNGGIVVASAVVYSDITNTWAGVTERYDGNVELNRAFTGGEHKATASETPRTVTLTSSSSDEAVVAASWV